MLKNIRFGNIPIILSFQKMFGINRSHATVTSGGNRLAINFILHVAAGENTFEIGFGGSSHGFQITGIVHVQSLFDKLASFVGLVPARKGSGETEYDRGITFRKNKILRPLIIEAAWVAVAADPALTMKLNQLRKIMSGQKAIIRIVKKILSRMRYVWINQKEYVKAVIK